MIEKFPKLTVSIALYKTTYLKSLFNTLKSQTYKNVEYIISNDQPNNPETKKFSDKMEDEFKDVKVFNHFKPLGAIKNYDFCFEKSNGKYFIRIDDDDDFKYCDHLEKMVFEIEKGYDFVLANVDIETIRNNKLIGIKEKSLVNFKHCESQYDFAQYSIIECAMIFYSMFRISKLREYYKYVKQKKNRYHFFEGLFCHMVASEMKGKFLNNQFYIYRVSDESVSQSSNTKKYFNNFFSYSIESLGYFLFKSPFSINKRIMLFAKMLLRVLPINIYYLTRFIKIFFQNKS